MRCVDREFDAFDGTTDLALGIGNRLAMLSANRLGQHIDVGNHQFAQLENHRLACGMGGTAPALARFFSGRHGAVQGLCVGVITARNFFACGRVEHRPGALAGARFKLAVDEMSDE